VHLFTQRLQQVLERQKLLFVAVRGKRVCRDPVDTLLENRE
jgi:hypothetical protein